MRYRVAMEELSFYSVYVEAANATEAEQKATEKFDKGTYELDGYGGQHVTSVEQLPDEC